MSNLLLELLDILDFTIVWFFNGFLFLFNLLLELLNILVILDFELILIVTY